MAILAVTAAVSLTGCDTTPRMDYSSVGLVDAEGTVTLDGQPLPGAVVTFDSPDGTFSYGLTDADGYYELQFDSDMQGVTQGPKTVQISTTRKILGLNTDDGSEAEEVSEEEGSAAPTSSESEKVPAKYNKDSELTVEVTPDQTEYDFDLKS
ncbi:transthyretin-like family protein [Candidatus Laterigemmans baculatus]|uniref:carboxypeptidase-like regulatory domain-containing protein n=1 Tax=Candidatus Laterigemmans baculatus TaxID=2770505 RepID=UPI0013DD0B62|nr:carboxypeptidase-like regulatory domain-containing protein [Candidatus Laterigemmans baculatus]